MSSFKPWAPIVYPGRGYFLLKQSDLVDLFNQAGSRPYWVAEFGLCHDAGEKVVDLSNGVGRCYGTVANCLRSHIR
jgi:hypothetical protein